MNTSRLRETIEQLLQTERTTNFQALLSEAHNHLSVLVNQPNSSPHQTAFAEAMQRLRSAYSQLQEGFEPAEVRRFEEIGATILRR